MAIDATYEPPVYDYGVSVVHQRDEVYVDGRPDATAEQYSQQAIELANSPAEQPPPPVPSEPRQQAEWLPLGVWALTQEDKGDAYMFVQISIDKNGVVTGAYQNVLSGDKSPISGQVDKKTQRAAWKIGGDERAISVDCRQPISHISMIRPTKEHLFRIRRSIELGLKNHCCPKETLV